MTDTELMQQALNLLQKFREGQTILVDHQKTIEAALEARINAPANGLAMEPRIIKTEADYEAAMAELDALLDLDPAPGTPEYDQLDLLAERLEQYEWGYFPVSDPAHGLAEAVATWEATNPEPEDNRKETVICRVEGKYVPFNRTVLPASITEILMYWPCGVELCEKLNNGETL